MSAEFQTEGVLLLLSIVLLTGSVSLYIITGRPKLRYLVTLNLCLLFWLICYGINVIFYNTISTGFWQMISLMCMTLLLFSFIAAFVDYFKKRDDV